MQRLEVSDLSDCVVVERDIPNRPAVVSLLDFDYDWEQDLNALNQLMRCCKNFTDEKISLLNAVIEEVRPQTPHEAVSLAKNFEDIAALPGITRPDLYGQHILEIEEWQNIDPALQECVDVQLYGEIRAKQEHGQFSSWGYVGYRGDDPVVQEVFARWAQSEEQSEQPDQGPQMGGMV